MPHTSLNTPLRLSNRNGAVPIEFWYNLSKRLTLFELSDGFSNWGHRRSCHQKQGYPFIFVHSETSSLKWLGLELGRVNILFGVRPLNGAVCLQGDMNPFPPGPYFLLRRVICSKVAVTAHGFLRSKYCRLQTTRFLLWHLRIMLFISF